MPPTKKRKLAESASKHASTQQGIQKFGKISKVQLDRGVWGKNKLEQPNSKAGNNDGNPKKRKLDSVEEDLLKQESDCGSFTQARSYFDDRPAAVDHTLESSLPYVHSTSNRPGASTEQAPPESSNIDTPSKSARSCLELLALVSSSPSDLNSSPLSKSTQTPPSSPLSTPSRVKIRPEESPDISKDEIPLELQDLVDLHSSFLIALSLHYAHNGCLIPADLRNLTPTIERSWRKQRVSTDDIRRILALSQDPKPDSQSGKISKCENVLSLSNYGSGKICVEIEARTDQRRIQRRPINEEAMNNQFTTNLLKKWKSYTLSNSTSASPSTFISALSLAPIKTCTSTSKTSPLLAKGQRRLEDLKAGAILAQLSSTKTATSLSTPPTSNPKPTTPTQRTSNLLSRILAKQHHQSTLAPPPSPTTLHRKSALQRLKEIVPILEILTTSTSSGLHATPSSNSNNSGGIGISISASRGICSFSMPTLVQHLQMSLRNPIAKEDAVRCVRLLAKEVAPTWVAVREIGKVVGVTIRRGEGPGREKVGIRVGELLREL